MSKVQLKIPSWVATLLDEDDSDWLTLDKQIGNRDTVGSLLTELASKHKNFRQVVFDPQEGKVSDRVMVFLNDKILQSIDVSTIKLNDGDVLMLLDVYAGG